MLATGVVEVIERQICVQVTEARRAKGIRIDGTSGAAPKIKKHTKRGILRDLAIVNHHIA